jgi:ABC-type phosphate transport system substrate-binding protein
MRILPTLLLLISLPAAVAAPVIIGNPSVPALDRTTVERIYTGRVVEVGGMRVTPVNLPPGNAIRESFLRDFLAQDEDKYSGYWTVRRYVGKGTPPKELNSSAAVIEYVSKTEGAIGYVDSAEATAGVKVLLVTP